MEEKNELLMEKQPTIEELAWNFLHILGIDILRSYEFTINLIDQRWVLSIDAWEAKGSTLIQPIPSEKFFLGSLATCIDVSHCANLDYDSDNPSKDLRKVNISFPLDRLHIMYSSSLFFVTIETIHHLDYFVVTKEPVPKSWGDYKDDNIELLNVKGCFINASSKIYTDMVFNTLSNLVNAVKEYIPNAVIEHIPNAESDNSPHHVSDNVEEQLRELRNLLSNRINN